MPEGYFGQYLTIGVFLLVAVILVLGTLQLARLVRPAVPPDEKITTYESGIDPFGGAWAQVNGRYYLYYSVSAFGKPDATVHSARSRR